MTPKTRQEHADLIQALYKELIGDAYYVKLRPGNHARRALHRAQHLASYLARTVPFSRETDAELSGIFLGAKLRGGTPRAHAEITFIRDVLTVAQHANGPGYVTKDQGRRVERLFQEQARREATATAAPSPQSNNATPEAEMEEGLYLHDGERRVVVRTGPQPALIPAKLDLINLANGTRVKFSTHLVYGVERVDRIVAIPEPERHRGILIWSVGETFVATNDSNYLKWIKTAEPWTGDGGAVSYCLDKGDDGKWRAVDIRPEPKWF